MYCTQFQVPYAPEGYELGGWYGGEEKTEILLECLDGVVPAPTNFGWEQPTPPDSPPIPPQVNSADYIQTITELNELLTSGKPAETVEPAYQYAYPEAVPVAQPLDGYASSPGYNSASSSGYNGSSSPGYTSDSNASSDASSDPDPDWSVPERSASSYKKDHKFAVTATDDRKLRKKEQNKNAATRYRMKKKQQQQEILDVEKDLQDTNTSLKEKVTDLKREMKYLKSLLRDVYRAKGLIR